MHHWMTIYWIYIILIVSLTAWLIHQWPTLGIIIVSFTNMINYCLTLNLSVIQASKLQDMRAGLGVDYTKVATHKSIYSCPQNHIEGGLRSFHLEKETKTELKVLDNCSIYNSAETKSHRTKGKIFGHGWCNLECIGTHLLFCYFIKTSKILK